MKKIPLHPLSSVNYALVDDEDYARLKHYRWNYYKNGYAMRYTSRANGAKSKTFYLHLEIMQAAPGQVVDHVNRNKLDCRKTNLRSATHSQNQGNRRKSKINGKSSRFKGVVRPGWIAMIQINGKKKYLGTFTSEVEAARVYNEAALKHFGEFALLNKV